MAFARRILVGPVSAVLLLAACSVTEPSAPISPTPLATTQPTPSATTASPTEAETATPSPTPGPEAIPVFFAGQQAASNAPGLRVRSRPGTQQQVLALLPEGADLLVALGPVLVDGFGWYLVLDSDAADPQFTEGWVAAGFEPDPFLAPSSFDLEFNPFVAGFAHDRDGEFGPVRIDGTNYGVRWVAAATDADGCAFSVDLRPGAGTAVPAIRATIGGLPAPGDLYAQFFSDHPELVGDLFAVVTSDCSWALTFVRFQG
jgi:hypothetical protein